eukprot:6490886-Amphidinium_carterae.1
MLKEPTVKKQVLTYRRRRCHRLKLREDVEELDGLEMAIFGKLEPRSDRPCQCCGARGRRRSHSRGRPELQDLAKDCREQELGHP